MLDVAAVAPSLASPWREAGWDAAVPRRCGPLYIAGLVFPPSGVDIRSAAKRKSHDVPWDRRTATAFFRGNATGTRRRTHPRPRAAVRLTHALPHLVAGPGTDAASNQRIRLAQISHLWRSSAEYGPGNAVDGTPYLDAGSCVHVPPP